MKLIIDIPNSLYANLAKIRNGSIENKRILDSVKNGIPLDDVKAEIEEKSFGIFDSPNLIKTIEVFEIIDNIGKIESEDSDELLL